jgi:hypothetical protein
VLVFAVSLKLDLVTLFVQAPNNVSLIDILLDKSVEIESNRDNLPMCNLVLELAVNKMQDFILHKYLLYLFTIVLSHN